MARTTAIFYKPQHLFADTIARMITRTITQAVIALSLAFASSPALAQGEAPAAVSGEELAFAKQKFAIAVVATGFFDKGCTGVSKLQYEAARVARDHYAPVLDASGETAYRQAVQQQTATAYRRGTCQQIERDQNVAAQIGNVGYLLDELLLAVHYAETESCGIYTAEEWGKLRTVIASAVPTIQQRPDLGLIEPVARERARYISGKCASQIIAGSAILLDQTTYGQFLREAVEVAKAL